MIRTKFFKLTTNTRTVQETVRRITNEILGGKVLSCLSMKPSEIFKINAGHVMCVCVCVWQFSICHVILHQESCDQNFIFANNFIL